MNFLILIKKNIFLDVWFLIILPLNLCIGKNMKKFNKKTKIIYNIYKTKRINSKWKLPFSAHRFLRSPLWSSIFLYLLGTQIHHWWFEWWVDEICLLSCAWSSHYQQTKVWKYSSVATPAQAAGLVRFGNPVHFVTGFAISVSLLYSIPDPILFIR